MASSDSAPHRQAKVRSTGDDERRSDPWLSMTQVVDHALLDRDGRRAGRVDDLQFDVETRADGSPRLVLRALVSGPLPRPWPRFLAWLAHAGYGLLGIRRPAPTVVEWSHVTGVDAFVHLDVDRDQAGLRVVDTAALKIVEAIPGADRYTS